MNCMRYFGMTSMAEIDRVTLPEYRWRMKAANLRNLDKIHYIHLQSWTNRQVKAARRNGSPVYKRFRQFFNFEKEEKKLLEKEKKEKGGAERIRRFIAWKEGEKNG